MFDKSPNKQLIEKLKKELAASKKDAVVVLLLKDGQMFSVIEVKINDGILTYVNPATPDSSVFNLCTDSITGYQVFSADYLKKNLAQSFAQETDNIH